MSSRFRAILAALLLHTLVGVAAAEAASELLSHAQRAIGSRDAPPRDPAAWQPVSLPEVWSGPSQPDPEPRWFRFTLEIPDPDDRSEPWGVLVKDIAMNVEVRWNGSVLGNGGRFDPPVSQNFHRPLYFPVPTGLIRSGTNVIDVRAHGIPYFDAWLGPLRVGPDRELAPLHRSGLFWRQRIPEASTLMGLVVALLIAAFWIGSRQAVYGWFALGAISWSVGNLNMHVSDLPLPSLVWVRLIGFSINFASILFSLHLLELMGVARPRITRFLLGYSAAVALLMFATPGVWLRPVSNVLYAMNLVIASYTMVRIARRARTVPRSEVAMVAPVGIAVLVIIAHDIGILYGTSVGAPRFWFFFCAPLFIFYFGAVLTLRFVRTFRQAERNNEELEQRVREKHRELQSNFEKLRELEDERVLTRERERMMREVHDGLGGRLVETLSLVESESASPGEVAAAIRGSLDEMRLLIDSLDPLIDDLATLLGTLRGRLEPNLRRRGVALEWRVEELPPLPRLGPQGFIHVLRIVQESLTNVVKHADASLVIVSARAQVADGEEAGVWIEIEDDGRGLPEGANAGRGLGNMRKRAEALGGRLEIKSRTRGTAVSLWLPEEAMSGPSKANASA